MIQVSWYHCCPCRRLYSGHYIVINLKLVPGLQAWGISRVARLPILKAVTPSSVRAFKDIAWMCLVEFCVREIHFRMLGLEFLAEPVLVNPDSESIEVGKNGLRIPSTYPSCPAPHLLASPFLSVADHT